MAVTSDLVIDGVLLAFGFFRRTTEVVVLLIRGLSVALALALNAF